MIEKVVKIDRESNIAGGGRRSEEKEVCTSSLRVVVFPPPYVSARYVARSKTQEEVTLIHIMQTYASKERTRTHLSIARLRSHQVDSPRFPHASRDRQSSQTDE